MMAQARDAGVKVLVYTVDYPLAPRSEVAARTGVSMATGPTWRTFPRLCLDAMRHPFWSAEYLRGGGLPKLESWAVHAPPERRRCVLRAELEQRPDLARSRSYPGVVERPSRREGA